MKIRKEKSQYYKRRMAKLFEEAPESKYIANRYRTIRYTLLEKYPWIESIPKEEMLTFLRETVYIDRVLRMMTEEVETTTKKILSEQFQVEELGYAPQIKLQFKD